MLGERVACAAVSPQYCTSEEFPATVAAVIRGPQERSVSRHIVGWGLILLTMFCANTTACDYRRSLATNYLSVSGTEL